MLKIRLRRTGKRHQPTYRVVVVEHTAPVQGSYLESVGFYNPRAAQFTVEKDRVLHWLNNGAQPSERIAKLLKNAGVEHKLIALPDYSRKPKRAPKKAAPDAPTAEKTEEVTETTETPETTEAAEPTETREASTTPEAVEATEANEAPAAESTEGGSNPEAVAEAESPAAGEEQ